ncbi:MAG: hypothetical protein JNL83_22955, partial [Myxococcales bacterium]|nr:hypothetical protein [Myxococcales bacterium]
MHRVIETSVIGTDDERRTVHGWLARRRMRSQLRRAREWTGTGVEDGTLVKVTGSVRAIDDRIALAPLSGRPCVYAWTEIRVVLVFVPPDPALRGTGWSAVAGRIVARERTGVPFSIEDRGRRVFVDPAGADAALVFDRVSRTVTRSSVHWSRATA